MYCDICETNKRFYIYRICKLCNNLEQNIEVTICNNCKNDLTKLIYCEEFENIDLRYENYVFEKKTCNECGIETFVMQICNPLPL